MQQCIKNNFTFIQRGIKVIGIVVRFPYLLCRHVLTLFILYCLFVRKSMKLRHAY